MTVYQCPRGDLGCTERFPTTGDLDYHLHLAHEYSRLWRFTASLSRTTALPVGPKPVRRVPDGLEGGPGTLTTAQARRSGTGVAERPTEPTARRPADRPARRPTGTTTGGR